jgi:hypothetical protein
LVVNIKRRAERLGQVIRMAQTEVIRNSFEVKQKNSGKSHTEMARRSREWFMRAKYEMEIMGIYRMSQEERSTFWEVIVSVILSIKVYAFIRPIPNSFQDIAFHSTIHCTDEKHTLSSREFQSALMLTVEFLKMHYTR